MKLYILYTIKFCKEKPAIFRKSISRIDPRDSGIPKLYQFDQFDND